MKVITKSLPLMAGIDGRNNGVGRFAENDLHAVGDAEGGGILLDELCRR